MMTPAIVLSSHVTGLNIIRSLGRHGVPVTAVSYEKRDMGRTSGYLQELVLAPHPERQEQEFVQTLMTIGKRLGRCIIMPADDATLGAVSRNKAVLSDRFITAFPDWNTAGRIIDKTHTYRLAREIGLASPRTITAASEADLRKIGDELGFPCLVKPSVSHRYHERFGRKMAKVMNHGELVTEYKRSQDAGLDVLIQEYIPGADDQGMHYNSYRINGEHVAETMAAKVRMSPPDTGVTRVAVSRADAEVASYARTLLKALNFEGFSCTEFKKDTRDGVWKLLEVNGRHNRSGALSVTCGVDFPWIEYSHRVLGRVTGAPEGLQGVYWIDEFHDAIMSLRFLGREKYSPKQYIRPYLRPHVFAVMDGKDIRPFFTRCADLLRMIIKRG